MGIMDAAFGAANNAAQGALTARIIGNANDRANEEEERADGWHAYAQRLEIQIEQLKLALAKSHSDKQELALKLKNTEEQFEKFKGLAGRVIDSKNETCIENVKYGKEIKKRLRQMEKGLQHSSADFASVNFMLNAYKEIFGDFSILTSNNVIPSDTKDKAEAVWNAFMNGDKLTENPLIQQVIDKAPMPLETSRIII